MKDTPQNGPSDKTVPSPQLHTDVTPTAPLPEPIAHNIDTIVELQAKEHRNLSHHHWAVEQVASFFSRPAFLYGILLTTTLWVIPNVFPRRLGIQRFDPPPFYALQGIVSFSGLLINCNRGFN